MKVIKMSFINRQTVNFLCVIAVTLLAQYFAIWHDDISLYDETMYLRDGVSIESPIFNSYEKGGAYSFYYRIIGYFQTDCMNIYYLGGAFVFSLASILIYVTCFVVSQSTWYSLFCFGLFNLGQFYFTIPRVSFFAIILICLIIILAKNCSRVQDRMAIYLIGSFLLAFTRPEFVISFYIVLFFLAIYFFFFSSKSKIIDNSYLVISFILLLFLISKMSFPVLAMDSRAVLAFGQHFSLRKFQEGIVTIDPWLNWEEIFHHYFPSAKSVIDAIIINPYEYFYFVLKNTYETLLRIFGIYFFWGKGSCKYLLIACNIYCCFIIIKIMIMKNYLSFKLKNKVDDIILLIPLMLPPLMSVVFVYPRPHYILILILLSVLLVGLFVRENLPASNKILETVLVLGMFANLPYDHPLNDINHRKINALRAIVYEVPIRVMLEADGGWCVYLTPQCKSIWGSNDILQFKNLNEYLTEMHIDSIYISNRLKKLPAFNDNKDFIELVDHPANAGWRKINVVDDIFLIRIQN